MRSVIDFPSPGQVPDLIDKILLRNSVNLLAGAPGVGKTALLAYLLPRFRDGKSVFGYQPRPVPKIAFLGADRSWDTSTRHWFDAAGYGDLPHYCLQDDRGWNPQSMRNRQNRIQILTAALDKLDLPRGSLVAVDPLAPFLGGQLNDYDACAVSCIIIRRLCQDRDLTIIGTAHAAKQKAEAKARYQRLQDRILGSTALHGYTDTQMYLASPEETGEKFYTFLWNPHHKPAEIFPLGRDAAGLFVPYADSVRSQEEGKVLAAITDLEDGTAFADIVIVSEVSRATVHRYLQELIKEGVVARVGQGRYRRIRPN
jgi:AAA domain/IclR helix-turn-helix domain